jgi:hypothetical protein
LNSSLSLGQGEDDPDRWGSPVTKRRGKGGGSRPCGRTRLGKGKLGRAEEIREEKRGRWTGSCGRREKGQLGLGRKEERKERGKTKRESGPGPIRKKREKKNCIQMHLNLTLNSNGRQTIK